MLILWLEIYSQIPIPVSNTAVKTCPIMCIPARADTTATRSSHAHVPLRL